MAEFVIYMGFEPNENTWKQQVFWITYQKHRNMINQLHRQFIFSVDKIVYITIRERRSIQTLATLDTF